MVKLKTSITGLRPGKVARILCGLLMLLLSLSFVSPKSTFAATDSTLNFQGRLQSSTGSIVADGTYSLDFKIYKSLASGASAQGTCSGGSTDDCLWEETYTGANKVTVRAGYFSVYLGSLTAFNTYTTINWDQSLWLTMNVYNTGSSSWDGEMSPRMQLSAVPYAFRAGQLAKLTGSNTSTLDFAAQTAANALLLPNESGTLCVETSVNCGFAPSSGGSGYVQLQGSTPGTAQTGNFNISGTGIAGTALEAPAFDTSSAGALTLGATNATSVTIGNTTTTTSISLQSGTGGISLAAGNSFGNAPLSLSTVATTTTSTGSISITTGNSTNANAGSITINVGTGGLNNGILNIGSTAYRNFNLATGAGTGTLTFGNTATPLVTHGSSISLGTNANSITFNNDTAYTNTSGTQNYFTVSPSFSPTSTSTATFVGELIQPTINFSAGTPGAGNTTALLINPTYTAAPTGTNLLLDLQNGGSSVFNVSRTGSLVAGTSGTSTNTITLEAGTASNAIQIGNSTTSHGIQIGTGATGGNADAVIIGSLNGSSSLLLQAGTGGLSLEQANGANSTTISFASPGAVKTITVPNETGTLCTTAGSASCLSVYAPTTGGTGYIRNGTSVQSSANFNIQSAASGSVGGVIRGAVSQSADLFELQDANGINLSKFDSNGQLTTYGTNTNHLGLATPSFTTSSSGTSYYYEITATNAQGETVGSPSLGMANNTSTLNWNQVNGATGYKIYRNTSNNFSSGSLLLTTITNGSTTGYTDTGSSTTAGLPPTAPTGTKLVVQSWNGQSADVFEVQNSSGTATAGFSGLGQLFTGTNQALSNTQASLVAASSSTIAAIIQGASGQSVDILDVQNSAGTNLFAINGTSGITNLVTNSDFETNTAGWSAKGSATLSQVTTQQYFDKGSMQIATTAAANDGAKYLVSLLSSTQYSFSFFAKASVSTANSFRLGYSNDGSTDTNCTSVNNSTGSSATLSTAGWQKYACVFTTGTVSGSPYVYVKQSDTTARNIWIDAVVLEATTSGNFDAYRVVTGQITPVLTAPLSIEPTNDSNAVFQVQDSSGFDFFQLDSLNDRVTSQSNMFIQPQGQLNLDTVTTSQINIGTNSNGKTINIGPTTTVPSQTYNIDLGSLLSTAGTVINTNINSSTGTGDAVNIESGTGSTAIQIGNGGTAHGIQIGTGAAVQTIVIGSTNSSSSLALQAGTGGLSLVQANGANSTTISFASPGAVKTITVPNETGTLCTTAASASCTAVYAPASGSGSYIQNSTSLLSENFNIQTTATGTPAGILEAIASQSVPTLEILDSGGNIQDQFGANGSFLFNKTSNLANGVGGTILGVDLAVEAGSITATPLAVAPFSANQTGDLFEVLANTHSTVLAKFDFNGDLTLAPLQPASVAGTGTNANTVLAVTGAQGGNTSGTTNQVAGAGGGLSLQAGAGGNASAVTGNSSGGAAGTIALTAGAGGLSNAATGVNGGAITITSGAGGATTGAFANSNGGAISIQGGAAGTGGSGAAGSVGAISIQTSGGSLSEGSTSGTYTLEGGSGATAIQIGNGNSTHGIQIGSGSSAVNTIVIGTQNSSSSVNIQAGTGGLSLVQANGANSTTISFASPGAVKTITVPNETGTLCTTAASAACTSVYGSASGSGSYIQNTTTIQTNANFAIQSAASGNVGGIIKGATSQSSDLFELQDSGGNINAKFSATGNTLTLGRIASSGTVTAGNLILGDGTTDNFGATLTPATLTASRTITVPNESGTICTTAGSSACTSVYGSASGSGSYIQNTAVVQTNANFAIQSANSANVGGVIKAAASQSVDLFELQDSSGNITAKFSSGGNTITLGRIASSGTVTAGSIVLGDGTTDNFGATLNTSTITASRTISLPDANGTICLQNASGCGFATGSGAAVILQAGTPGSAQTGHFNITGTGIAGILQASSIDTASAGTLNIGPTNANLIVLNQNTSIASNKTLTADGSVLLQDATNSTSAFQIQNNVGSNIFKVDTSTTVNLVTNGDFERNTTAGWTLKGSASFNVISTQQEQGNYSLDVHTTAAANDGAKYNLTLASSTTYTLSFYAKVDTGATANFVYGYAFDGSTENSATTSNAASPATFNTSWTRYTFSFPSGTVSGTPYLFFKQADATTRHIYIDSVQLEQGSSATAFSPGGAVQILGVINSPVSIKPIQDSGNVFELQNASGTSLLDADTNAMKLVIGSGTPTLGSSTTGGLYVTDTAEFAGQVRIGTATNGVNIDAANHQVRYSGTARNVKRIRLTAEYAGAVLDPGSGSSNNGTMTAAIDSTNRMNYYNWTTLQSTSQSYDIVVQVPVPSDFSAWNSTNVTLSICNSVTTANTIQAEVIDSGGTNTGFTDITNGSTSCWQTATPSLLTGTFTAGDFFTIRIRLTSPASGNIRVGNIYMDYLSAY